MKKTCLIILDGFGVAPPGPGNARTLANMPTVTRLEKEMPNVIMEASGNAAGLPDGQQGASEPGHLVMGAGRIVWHTFEEINREIKSGEYFENPVLVSACERAVERDVPMHLFGIYSYGGVHGHADQVHAMIELADKKGVKEVYLHLIGDGRDVPKQQFSEDYTKLEEFLKKHPNTKLISLVGRYLAMDRDKQFKDRTKLAYDMYTQGIAEEVDDLCKGAKAWYEKAPEKQKTDYYIQPIKTKDFVPMQPDDVVVGTNFRTDRMFQIVDAFEGEDFKKFERPFRIKDVVCTGPYSNHLPIAYPMRGIKNTLIEVVTDLGVKVLKITETDKATHTTFFFNGQTEKVFPGEDRILVESPKVPNFASAPEMSTDEMTDKLIEQVEGEKYGLIVSNYPSPDLVGHGANVDAAVIACETVDRNLGRLLPVLEEHGYDWVITADHGNLEAMILPSGEISPSHTTNPVQTFVHSDKIKSSEDIKEIKGLKDIAPLVLKLMEIPIPEEMK